MLSKSIEHECRLPAAKTMWCAHPGPRTFTLGFHAEGAEDCGGTRSGIPARSTADLFGRQILWSRKDQRRNATTGCAYNVISTSRHHLTPESPKAQKPRAREPESPKNPCAPTIRRLSTSYARSR